MMHYIVLRSIRNSVQVAWPADMHYIVLRSIRNSVQVARCHALHSAPLHPQQRAGGPLPCIT